MNKNAIVTNVQNRLEVINSIIVHIEKQKQRVDADLEFWFRQKDALERISAAAADIPTNNRQFETIGSITSNYSNPCGDIPKSTSSISN